MNRIFKLKLNDTEQIFGTRIRHCHTVQKIIIRIGTFMRELAKTQINNRKNLVKKLKSFYDFFNGIEYHRFIRNVTMKPKKKTVMV